MKINKILKVKSLTLPFLILLSIFMSVECQAEEYSNRAFPLKEQEKEIKFEDVVDNLDIEKVVKLGYMNGYSEKEFGADDTLTRAQFAQVLYNTYSKDFIGTNTPFRDIWRGQWFTPAVSWVVHYNIMKGYEEEVFGPNDEVSRQQVIRTLYKIVGKPKCDKHLSHLEGSGEIADYAYSAYRWALEEGIEKEIGHPKESITRGELAELLVRFNDFVVREGYNREEKKPNLLEMSPEEFFFKKTMYEPHNHELQDYLPEQVELLENGAILTAVDCGNKIYKSGNVQSKVSFRYGVFEFEFNNLRGQGYWPAIWMLPDSKVTRFPELDIYEMVGDKPYKMYGTLHHFDKEKSKKSNQFEYSSDNFLYRYDKHNIPEKTKIKLEWTKDSLVWTINDKVVNKISHDVPDNYMYLIMNLAIGGDWPGDPDSTTQFPVQFIPKIIRFEPVEYKYRGT